MLVDYVRVYKPREPEKTSLLKPHPSTPATKAGAPYLDSEMWASSERRPPSSPKSEPAK
jgi:hypothetical protein